MYVSDRIRFEEPRLVWRIDDNEIFPTGALKMNEDTLRIVIGIVPGWQEAPGWHGEDQPLMIEGGRFCGTIDAMQQCDLDALAAAAVRVVLETNNISYAEGYSPITGNKVVMTYWSTNDQYTTRGDDRTENTLNAIAEFVKAHPEAFG